MFSAAALNIGTDMTIRYISTRGHAPVVCLISCVSMSTHSPNFLTCPIEPPPEPPQENKEEVVVDKKDPIPAPIAQGNSNPVPKNPATIRRWGVRAALILLLLFSLKYF